MTFKDPENWMTERELQWLYEQTKTHSSIVEVGSHKGRGSSAPLANGTVKWGGKLTCVDCFEDIDWFNCFKTNILNKFPTVRLIKNRSVEAAKLFLPRSVEMVFIDADHSYESVKADIEAWKNVPSKMFCGHDYDTGWKGVKEAVDEVFPSVERIDSIWIVRL